MQALKIQDVTINMNGEHLPLAGPQYTIRLQKAPHDQAALGGFITFAGDFLTDVNFFLLKWHGPNARPFVGGHVRGFGVSGSAARSGRTSCPFGWSCQTRYAFCCRRPWEAPFGEF